ncbi:hypothetical protein PSEWESI4_03522 [Pseudomonas carbonaria]|uniref:Collagen pro alpha-chain n=1 Tax=Zestomonas carbonaria TaxID=2762745 RepID=A0A7U7IAH9_9GAMM|nr:hypothetical protein PSEWESI4_03522 [Pseudomonas carbonaria]
MRSLALLAILGSSLALADAQVKVAPHTLLRLPTTTGLLVLDRLEIADAGTLLIPSTLTEIRVGELSLGREASIGIAPSDQEFRLEARHAEFGAGSRISARGAAGSHEKPATAGRNLSLRLEQADLADLILDVRGGAGAPGYAGLDGANGKSAGCAWGQASRGHDGLNGGDGRPGGAGGRIRLEVPEDFPAENVQVRLEGGAGGVAGTAGQGGRGGSAKGCWIYSTDGPAMADRDRPGNQGRPAGKASSIWCVSLHPRSENAGKARREG